MRWTKFLILGLLFFIGCSNDATNDDANASSKLPSNTPQVEISNNVGNAIYHLSEDIQSTYIDSNSVALSAYEGIISGIAIEDSSGTLLSKSRTLRNVLGDLTQKLTLLESSLYYVGDIEFISKVTQQTYIFPFDQTTAEYKISTFNAMSSSDLVGLLTKSIFSKSNYPNRSSKKSSDFRMMVSVSIIDSNIYYILTVVPEENKNEYGEIASSMIRATNLSEANATVTTVKDTFTQVAGNNNADFLFVVDDSGSMSEEQEAIKQAANDFEQAILNSNIQNYNIAIISTGSSISNSSCSYISSCASALVNTYTSFDNISDFKNHVVLGTSGSGTETGIFNAESVLKQDGVLSKKGFPENGNLSVIVISDEPSQYNSRAYQNFSLYENVFTKNAYQVYSIIDEYDPGDYKNLSAVTGGFSASIENKSPSTNQLDFSELMEKVAVGASGAISKFTLSKGSESNYIVSILSVKINDSSVAESVDSGWAYSVTNNSIVFYGNSKPKEGDIIDVEYNITEAKNFVSVISQCSIKDVTECTTELQCVDIKDASWINNSCSIVEKVCSADTPEYCDQTQCTALGNHVWDNSNSSCTVFTKSQEQINCENGGYSWEMELTAGSYYCNIPINPLDLVKISGTIYDPVNNTPLSGVKVIAISGADTFVQTTDNSGNFLFEDLFSNAYILSVSKDSYANTQVEVVPKVGESVYIGQIEMVPSGDGSIYTIGGVLINALSSETLSAASIEIHSGYQSPNGQLVTSLQTDSEGVYTTSLQTGYYTFVIKKNGYIDRETNVLIWDSNITQDLTLSPALESTEEMRITLTWGESPLDLDAHLAVMDGSTRTEHIYFSNKTANSGDIVLDRDDAKSFGPETITISTIDKNLTYKYYVQEYASDIFNAGGEISRSSATVTVDTASESFTFNIPNGEGTTWKVFEIVNGNIEICSTDCIFYSYSVIDDKLGQRKK